jgi:cytochrome P450
MCSCRAVVLSARDDCARTFHRRSHAVVTLDLGVDLLADRLEGDRIHHVLAEARSAPGLATVTILGETAHLVTRTADLRAFLGDDETFPGATTYRQTVAHQVGDTFISMDKPDHDTYRHLTTPAFRSRAVARFVDGPLAGLAHEVVDRFADRGAGDLVAELCRVLPFWAITRKLGLPRGDDERMRELALAMFGQRFATMAPEVAAAEIAAVIQPELDRRRAEPGDDVLSRLVTAERGGRRLDDAEIINHVRLLFSVGATTTADAMANLLWLVLTVPGVWDVARRDPRSHAAIVAEALRMEPSVVVLPRRADHGGVVGSTELPPGALVAVGLAAANRDPERFSDPDRFDLGRPTADLWTFGFGVKFCPGTHLARQQLAVALAVVTERLVGLELVASEGPAGGILRSTASLEATWQAHERRG